jgi:hypothetical protein
LDNTTTNQKLAFVVGGILGRVHDLGGTCGVDAIPLFGAANRATKKIKINFVALNGCQLIFQTQQPTKKHAGITKDRKARRFNKGGAWGKRDSILLLAKESGGM